MKIVHVMTESGAVKADKEVADNYQLQANESFTLSAIPAYTLDYQPIIQAEGASFEQRMIMIQSQQITSLQSMVMQQNQSDAKLQATNKNQAKQIKQLQQMFMTANQQQAVEKSKEAMAQ
ncbi:hypothetical protein ADV92_01780 [Limosilactobacillus reuteri]|uniref:hypothetical protein n=1 Tax=Limosilactobacillus reuteri TaxID=1598 RepID=UPI0007A93A1B|nr:hypothetical protein [Limosilactobacillus reuteri]AMY13351.1 hypothetical protein ADV92_01780 [Limosilactobacillus reuteri]